MTVRSLAVLMVLLIVCIAMTAAMRNDCHFQVTQTDKTYVSRIVVLTV